VRLGPSQLTSIGHCLGFRSGVPWVRTKCSYVRLHVGVMDIITFGQYSVDYRYAALDNQELTQITEIFREPGFRKEGFV